MATIEWAPTSGGGSGDNDQLGGFLNAAETSDGNLNFRANITAGANNTLDYLVAVYEADDGDANTTEELLGFYYVYKNTGGNVTSIQSSFSVSSLGLDEGESYTLKVYEGNVSTSNATGTDYTSTSIPAGTWTEKLSATFVYDATAPGAPSVSLAADSGVNGDKITNTAGLTVTGDTGATFEYATSLNGQGNWQSTPFAPTQGSNTVYVRQVDAAGNPGTLYTTFTYTYDTQAAAVTLGLVTDSGSADNRTNVGTVEVKSGQETGATVYYSTSENGTYATTAPDFSGVADGLKTVWAYQVDVAGNQSAKSSYSFTLDTTPPVASLSGTRFEDQGDADPSNDYYLIDKALTFTGTVDAGSSNVILTLKDANGATVFTDTLTTTGGQAELKPDGTWTYDASGVVALAAANGEMFTLEVTATDGAANTGTTSFTNVKIDATAPPVPKVSDFKFAPADSKWKHDVAALGYIGDVLLTTDPTATVTAWIQSGNQKLYEQNAVFDATTGNFVWSPTLDPATGERILLSTLYSPLEFSLAAVDEAGNIIESGGGKPAVVNVVYGAHAVEYGDDPSTLDVETNFVLNDINDNLVGSNGYDDLIVGFDGDDFINGQAGNDFLFGGQGIDTILGGVGNDEITGGTQADLLDGGAGADRFIYSRFNESQNSSRDRIVDFNGAEDVIDVSELCRALGIAGSFNSAYTFGSSGTDATTTKVKGKTVTTGSTAAKGEFWLGSDGVLYGNLDNNTGADFAVALVTPNLGDNPATLDTIETDFLLGYNAITSTAATALRTPNPTWLDFSV